MCLLVGQKIVDAEDLKSLEDRKSYGIMAPEWKDKCMYNLTDCSLVILMRVLSKMEKADSKYTE